MNSSKARALVIAWAIGLFGFAFVAEGKVVYVAKTGKDANNGLAWSTAKLTVQAGLNAAAANDQVWVAAGTYVEKITLKADVALYGGFAGNETDLTQRNWAVNKAILDGNAWGTVVTSPSGAGALTRIDGLTIQNGRSVQGDTPNSGFGGGICCSSSSPTIANNTIVNNRASVRGGGIYCTSSSSIVINNTIAGNSAYGSDGESAWGCGGGICADESPSAQIINNRITGNSATYATGGSLGGGRVEGNVISDNSADKFGGGVQCASNTILLNNVITGNTTLSEYGAVYCPYGGAPVIANNTIVGNYASCGIYCGMKSSPRITNNTITGHVGDAVFCDNQSSPRISNTIIAYNEKGIRCASTSASTLLNNCVYGNTVYNYSGVTDPTGSKGNLSVEPGLAGAPYGNVHIQPGSPCLGAGLDSEIQPDWKDLDGQPRKQGEHVDIGVDESDGTTWPGGPAVIVRVSAAGDDNNDGSSWLLAKRTVQSAIDAASIQGGDVWVSLGTYGNRITLKRFVHVYGGFAGNEAQRSERNWSMSKTVLDGQQGGNVVTAEAAGYRLNSIDGFTIRNGQGAGIYCVTSSPTIANNVIADNFGGAGGGIYCLRARPLIANNAIVRNEAAAGGIHCESSSPTIVNNTIASNYGYSAGAIYCKSSSPVIVNTIVAFNFSGIVADASSTPVLRHNCVYGNTRFNYSGMADPTGSNGNTSVDPVFAARDYGNTHIQPLSPCVDAGDDGMVSADGRDLDGQPRKQGVHVDIGADESDGTSWPTGPAMVVRVGPAGDDANDGSSWNQAMRTVQGGIDAASVSGGEVWVKTGVNNERVTLKPCVHLYGGFRGTETQREERDWNVYPTVLDGQQGGRVVTAGQAGYKSSTVDGFIIQNGRADYGGGVYCRFSSPTITNNTIRNNTATTHGGGGVYCEYSAPTISNNTIVGNAAPASTYGGGGGICCAYSSFPLISNNTILRNRTWGLGGGVSCSDCSPTLISNAIAGNVSTDYFGGGIGCRESSLVILDNVIVGNTADISGGGIYCFGSSSTSMPPTITNNTVVGNVAQHADGGGIYLSGSFAPTISNTVIAFNSSGVCQVSGGVPVVRHGCVYGNTVYDFKGVTNPTGSSGNISVDPRLVRQPSPGADGKWGTADDDYGDLHLQAGSPCIDAGQNSSVPAGIVTDFDGGPRFVDDPSAADTGSGTPPIVDMGAYEHIPGDFDFDGDIDTDDMRVFIGCVSGPSIPYSSGCGKADFDRDNDVDQRDFGVMQRCYSGAGKPVDPACVR